MADADKPESDDPKRQLEIRKLQLEGDLLARQLSRPGRFMEWLKATTVPATLVGALLAYWVGFGQLRQASETQAAERFDKALTRLASEKPDDRLIGVSGIQLFLNERGGLLQGEALQFLVNAASLEKDQRVQGTILDVLDGIPAGAVPQGVLNDALDTAVKRNRNLSEFISGSQQRDTAAEKWKLLAAFGIKDIPADPTPFIPPTTIAKLPLTQYLSLLGTERGAFERHTAEDVPLAGLTKAIEILIAHGAKTRDFEGIYCEGCDFTQAGRLDGASFAGSFLERANFAHASLVKTSFRDADLGQTNFFAADLTGADLHSASTYLTLGWASAPDQPFPLLECATLKGADLSGRPLATVTRLLQGREAGASTYVVAAPKMRASVLDASTKLDELSIVGITVISDGYLAANPTDPDAAMFVASDARSRPWPSPLAGQSINPVYRRSNDQIGDPDLAETRAFVPFLIRASDLDRLEPGASLPQAALAQPRLQALPLLAQLTARLAALPPPASALREMSDPLNADARRAEAEPAPSCTGTPDSWSLVLTLAPVRAGGKPL